MKLKMMTSATIVPTSLAATLLTVGCLGDAPEMKTPDTNEVTATTAQQLGGGGAVTVYDDSQYLGYAQSLGIGYYDWGQIHNDTISSLRVPAGMTAVLYSDTHFLGQYAVVTQDMPWIGDEWNDQVSSIIVTQPSRWNCFTRDGRYRGTIDVFWSTENDPPSAAAACDQALSDCINNPGLCTASGTGIAPTACDVTSQIDGCSIPIDDGGFREIFRDACNAHDACYHAPWDTLGGDGFDTCNTNFWNDMNSICDAGPWYNWINCRLEASVWADAMNFYPGRSSFWNSFQSDQAWVRNNCLQ
jgi:hypothetical protein